MERRRCDQCKHVVEVRGEDYPPDTFYGWAVIKTMASDGWVLKRRDLCPDCAPAAGAGAAAGPIR